MATLQENIRQVNGDFQAIKAKIVEKGVEVANGTRTSEYAAKVDAVYEAGRQKEYDDFWDTFLRNGAGLGNTVAPFAGTSWYDARFKPKYNVKMTGNINYAFQVSNIKDFKGCIQKAGVNFTFEGITSAIQLFAYSQVENLPTLDFSLCSSTGCLGSAFSSCTKLKSIDKIIVSENTKFSANTFGQCSALEEVRFEGTIGGASGGLVLTSCKKLSKASFESIINALSDTSGTQIELSLSAVNKAFESVEGANNGSSTQNWYELIRDKTLWSINLDPD